MTLWRRWRTRLILFLAVLGPGFITANVDNDAGGILTYSQAGAQFGYTLLWTMIPITLALIVVQEMCARMGAVTGKGLSDLIREEFGLRMTFVMMILLVIVNFGNVITEFSGIAGSMQLFHITKYASVPICAFIVWLLVVKGDYKSVEKVFLTASVFYIAYIIAGVLSRPDWHLALVETIKLPPRSVWSDKTYIYMTVGVIGTTITPWMQFYLQSSIVEKGVGVRQYKASRLDVIVGSFFTDLVAWFIVVACAATLYTHGIRNIADPSDAAGAMKPLAGDYAFILFAAGLFNADDWVPPKDQRKMDGFIVFALAAVGTHPARAMGGGGPPAWTMTLNYCRETVANKGVTDPTRFGQEVKRCLANPVTYPPAYPKPTW